MSDIFSFRQESSTQAGNHWHSSSIYTADDIDKIKDPNLDSTAITISSIPSPFARIDLVWTAYKKCVENLEGNTLYHKLVSEALDIGQLLFTFEKFRSQYSLDLVTWDKAKGLERLKSSQNKSHNLIGRTLETFLDRDKDAYGFSQVDIFTFLSRGRNKDVILGGLSPVTLYFSSPEAKNNTNLYIPIDTLEGSTHKVFETITPLHKRNVSFQAYMQYVLEETKGSSKVPISDDFRRYVENSFRKLSDKNQEEVHKEKDFLRGKLLPLEYGANLTARIANLRLQEYKTDAGVIEEISHFVIRSPKFNSLDSSNPIAKDNVEKLRTKYGFKPLVLDKEFAEINYQYTSLAWKPGEINVPIREPEQNFRERRLPGTTDRYPYIIASDFLEDFLVKIPYKQDSEYFFAPKFENQDSKDYSFLFPLKPLYFDFFDARDAAENLEIKEFGNSVTVYLTIPIGNDAKTATKIKLSKMYYGNEIIRDINKVNLKEVSEKKEGQIVENSFGLGIFPPVYQPETVLDPHFRLLFIDNEESSSSEYQILLGKNETLSELEPASKEPAIRLKKTDKLKIESQYHAIERNFDFLQIGRGNGKVKGFALIKWDENRIYKPGGTEAFFGVDFGTTNTHIECKVGSDDSQAFQYEKQGKQVALFNKESIVSDFPNLQKVIETEFVPPEIKESSGVSYPHRTVATRSVLSEALREKKSVSDILIGFNYGKKDIFEGIEEITDLKWRRNPTDRADESPLVLYIDQMAFMIRNKCLLSKVDLKSVKIAITFPSSMSSIQRENILSAWKKSHSLYFSKDPGMSNKQILPVAESIAPYYYFRGVKNQENASVNIDIGGGTTDIVIFKAGDAVAYTSFRFAATTLFGSGIPETQYSALISNGYTKKYSQDISDRLTANKKGNFKEIQNRISKKNQAHLLADFWLSLGNEKELEEIVPFAKELRQGGNHKLPFLLFYVSILYYVSHFVKSLENVSPRDLMYSGMGSRVLSLLSMDSVVLNKVAKYILNYVFKDYFESNPGKKDLVDTKLELKIAKEITAKGAIEFAVKGTMSETTMKSLNKVYLGISPPDSGELMYSSIQENNSHPEFLKSIDQIKEFYEFFFDTLPKEIDLEDLFGIQKGFLAKFRNIALEDISEHAKRGITAKIKEQDANRSIEETLFFYPITDLVNRMGAEI